GPDPDHHGPGNLPCAARGHGVRGPADRRDVQRLGRPGDRVRGGRRADQKRPADADLRGRPAAPARRDRVRPGARARLCHPCRGGRGRLPGRARRGQRHGPGQPGRLPAGRGPRRRLRPALRRVRTAARLLRTRRERGHVPAAGHPRPRAGRRRTMTPSVTALRETVWALHAELVRNGLVAWTSGNVSARVPGSAELMGIKPSGVSYDDLTPDDMVVCDLSGIPVSPGSLSPSSDTATHAYIYRHMPEVGGVVHTHSTYATAWAARAEAIPCGITAMADEFGGEIPVGPFALIGSDEIGRGVVATLTGHRSPAVLMRSHGVFTIGGTARDAVKAAVMCEDAARTVHLARAFGEPAPLPADQVDALYARYQNHYGQRPTLGKE